jgi:hypothetical protein
MARLRKPRLELQEGARLSAAPIHKLTPEQYASLEKYIKGLLPRSNPLSAHPDDLYFVGLYFKTKFRETNRPSDLRQARRFLAAASQGTTDIWRNRALCWYADSLLKGSTRNDRNYGLRTLRRLAEEADISVAADAAWLLMVGYDQYAFVARRKALAIAEATLARYKAKVKELKHEIDEIRDDLEFNEKMMTRKSPAKRAVKR